MIFKILFLNLKLLELLLVAYLYFKGKYRAVLINYPNREEKITSLLIKYLMKQIIQDLKKGDTILEEVPVQSENWEYSHSNNKNSCFLRNTREC